jgi:hypothetical protein
VLIEIEPNPEIGKLTGEKVVSSAHGSGTYSPWEASVKPFENDASINSILHRFQSITLFKLRK